MHVYNMIKTCKRLYIPQSVPSHTFGLNHEIEWMKVTQEIDLHCHGFVVLFFIGLRQTKHSALILCHQRKGFLNTNSHQNTKRIYFWFPFSCLYIVWAYGANTSVRFMYLYVSFVDILVSHLAPLCLGRRMPSSSQPSEPIITEASDS